jgi:antitoxin (DNA-binding transcriptional repressor) of toxin-antitoxin stability system
MTISKGKLKGRMLEYFRHVEETGETLIVTDRGREVLEIKALKKNPNVPQVISRLRQKAQLSVLPEEQELMNPIPDWNLESGDVWLEEVK